MVRVTDDTKVFYFFELFKIIYALVGSNINRSYTVGFLHIFCNNFKNL